MVQENIVLIIKMLALQQYGSSDDENEGTTNEKTNQALHLIPVDADSKYSVQKSLQICAAPLVLPTVSISFKIVTSI